MPMALPLPLPAADSDYRLPALLLCDLERPSGGGAGSGVWVVEAGPDFLCLGADNKLYQVGGCAPCNCFVRTGGLANAAASTRDSEQQLCCSAQVC